MLIVPVNVQYHQRIPSQDIKCYIQVMRKLVVPVMVRLEMVKKGGGGGRGWLTVLKTMKVARGWKSKP